MENEKREGLHVAQACPERSKGLLRLAFTSTLSGRPGFHQEAQDLLCDLCALGLCALCVELCQPSIVDTPAGV